MMETETYFGAGTKANDRKTLITSNLGRFASLDDAGDAKHCVLASESFVYCRSFPAPFLRKPLSPKNWRRAKKTTFFALLFQRACTVNTSSLAQTLHLSNINIFMVLFYCSDVPPEVNRSCRGHLRHHRMRSSIRRDLQGKLELF